MPFQPDVRPALPTHLDHGIGIIGAGGIVEHGHLPAYRKFGLHVVAVASRREETVQSTARRWGVDRTFTDWRRLVELPEVVVVDVTYPFDNDRLAIVEHAAACGKHILMQKPLAHSMDAARQMVDTARRHGVQLAVNQNARWCPQYRAAAVAIREGWLGQPYFVTHQLQSQQDAAAWFQSKWDAQQERFQIIEYMIHHLDLVRFWLGMEPITVRATLGRKPDQHARGEMIASIQLGFDNGALAVVIDNNASHPNHPNTARFLIEGATGMVEGQAIPPASFTLRSERLGDAPYAVDLPGAWFPDAFAGTMGELLCAIEQQRPSSISGEDNLRSLQLVFDAYADAGQAVNTTF